MITQNQSYLGVLNIDNSFEMCYITTGLAFLELGAVNIYVYCNRQAKFLQIF